MWVKIFKIGTFRTNMGASPDLRGKMNERQGRRHLCECKMQKSAAFQLEGKCNKATMKDQDESLKAFNQAGKKQMPGQTTHNLKWAFANVVKEISKGGRR